MKRILMLIAATATLCSCSLLRSSTPLADDDKMDDFGYYQVKKDENTYAHSSLKVKGNEATAYTNMYDYLRGRVPGVIVSSSNTIQIRGMSSINLSTEPLIIVDGVEFRDLNLINPQDVESVDVLKDASTSLYGVRGANGVIIIKLKK